MAFPAVTEILGLYDLDSPPVWPRTQPVKQDPRWFDAGLMSWGNNRETGFLGGPGDGFGDDLVVDAGEDLAALEARTDDLGDFGASAIISAIGAGIGVAASAASTIGKVVQEVKKNESAEIKQARAAGASTAEIQAIRKGYAKKKKAARQLERYERRRKARAKLRKKGKPYPPHLKPKPWERPFIERRSARRGGARAARRRAVTPARRQAEAVKTTEDIAAGLSFATDILRRSSAFGQQVEFGASVDPFTGERVIHRPRTEVVPQAAVPVPVGTAPPPVPAGPPPGGFLATLQRPVVAGVPLWVLGVAIIGGGALLFGRRR